MDKPDSPLSSAERSGDEPFQIEFEGRAMPARQGDTVASALIAAGVQVLSRSLKFHRPRTVFCLSGSCGSCLLRIDGRPNTRSCQVRAEPGLRCARQNAWPSADYDLLSAADAMFPVGMDHHTLFTSPRPLNRLMQKMVHQIGGLGRLPDEDTAAEGAPSAVCKHVDILVIGAGPAGLAAATAAAHKLRGRGRVLLLESQSEVGGSYLCHPELGRAEARAALQRAEDEGVEVLVATAAFGFYGEDRHREQPSEQRGLIGAASEKVLYKLSAERYIYATGGAPQNLLFVDNDRPGVLSGRAVGRLLACHGIRIGERPLVVGNDAFAESLTAALRRSGQTVMTIDGERERLVRALGGTWVEGAEICDDKGLRRTVSCDLIVIAIPPAAASELLVQLGASVELRQPGGFVVKADEHGRTAQQHVFVCGEVSGTMATMAAAADGARVGKCVAAELVEQRRAKASQPAPG